MKQEKKLKRCRNIAIVHKDTHFMNQIDNAFYFSIRSAVEETCYQKNIGFTFVPYSFLDSFDRQIDGALVVGNFDRKEVDTICAAVRTGCMVFVGKVNYYPDRMDWISYSIKDCVYKAMGHLAAMGLKDIAYLGGYDSEDTPEEFSKFSYFKKFMAEQKQLHFAGSMVGEHGVESGYQMMKRWLREKKAVPDAFFVSNDPIAIGVIKALNGGRNLRAGQRIGDFHKRGQLRRIFVPGPDHGRCPYGCHGAGSGGDSGGTDRRKAEAD